jgi:hypothetical protein
MATVVTPHSASQSAMAVRSQELAPNRRTFLDGKAGKEPKLGHLRRVGVFTCQDR